MIFSKSMVDRENPGKTFRPFANLDTLIIVPAGFNWAPAKLFAAPPRLLMALSPDEWLNCILFNLVAYKKIENI